MKNKVSFDAFVAKAEQSNQDELMEKVQGGGWGDCHGFSGAAAKVLAIACCASDDCNAVCN